jgi:hypothetical protein
MEIESAKLSWCVMLGIQSLRRSISRRVSRVAVGVLDRLAFNLSGF